MSDNERLRHLENLERPPCVVGTLAGLTYATANYGGSDGTIYLAPANYPVNANYTVPANVHLVIPKGSYFTIANGMTLTVNGTIEAGPWQIFHWAGTGATAFGTASVNEIYPEWWGAVGDGITDCQVAFAKCEASIPADGVIVKLPGDALSFLFLGFGNLL